MWEFTVNYRCVSVPSTPGETDISLSLQSSGDKWTLDRTLGTMYEQESTRLEVKATDVVELISSIKTLRLPMLPDSVYGLDGTTHTLRIASGLNSVEYVWWDTLPESFEPLKGLIERLFKLAQLPSDFPVSHSSRD